jgi:predicted transcriptional regulator
MRRPESALNLSRRERQIMDVLYRDRQATAAEVLAALPDPPAIRRSGHAARARNQGHVRHVADGTRYVYLPTVGRERAGRPALAGVLETFFDGSTEKAVAALLELSPTGLSDEELDRLSRLIEQARLEGR